MSMSVEAVNGRRRVPASQGARTATVVTTRSDAVYVQVGTVLIRFKGNQVAAYHLESDTNEVQVGGVLRAIVLTNEGRGVARVQSTRIISVDRVVLTSLNLLEPKVAQMARVAAALDLVGPLK